MKSLSASEIFDLQFGDMKSLGENIADNSIDLIFTDPPYDEASLALYGDLARLADCYGAVSTQLFYLMWQYDSANLNCSGLE